MNASQASPAQFSNGRHSMPEPIPLLDVATIVGGGVLSISGLLRGGIRGWVSTSLGTLLLYRGILALQAHAAEGAQVGAQSGIRMTGVSSIPGTRMPSGLSDPMSAQTKGTCVSPGIVEPM